jgi:hypothetical protein
MKNQYGQVKEMGIDYLAMITVDQNRVILFVQDDFHNSLHDCF